MQARDRKISVPNVTNDSEAAAKFAAEHSLAATARLFRAEIPKAADVRATVVGEQVFAQRVTAPDGALDWRPSGWDALEHAPVQGPRPYRPRYTGARSGGSASRRSCPPTTRQSARSGDLHAARVRRRAVPAASGQARPAVAEALSTFSRSLNDRAESGVTAE